jgi:hypothetical protein
VIEKVFKKLSKSCQNSKSFQKLSIFLKKMVKSPFAQIVWGRKEEEEEGEEEEEDWWLQDQV